MKKILSLVLVLLILLSAVNVFGAEEQEETIGLNFVTYKVKDGEAEVFWVNREHVGTIIIPDSVNGYPVTSLGYYAFTDCTYVTEVILPDSIKTIKGNAFWNCTNLEKVNIPCEFISSAPFRYCVNLKEVVFGEKLRYVHHGVFSECKIEKLIVLNENTAMRQPGELLKPEPELGTFNETWIGTIYGYEGSTAETYANEMGIGFILLERKITIAVNGEKIATDTEPYIKNDRTMVPMRAIFEALGASVSWDDATKTAIGVKDGIEVKITIVENVIYKNFEPITLDCAAEITNDRTMVPVRAIGEAFGCTVTWNDETKTVEITN